MYFFGINFFIYNLLKTDYKMKSMKTHRQASVLFLASCLLFLSPMQISFGESNFNSISFGAGMFDMVRPKHQAFEFDIEYKFHLKRMSSSFDFLDLTPLVGAMMTAQGSGYVYAGINFDFLLKKHILIAPGFAAGYYWQGKGKDLGYPIEFRSGLELAWQFSDRRRLGLHFYHLSNASLVKRNPGEESLVIYYELPLVKGFPFYN